VLLGKAQAGDGGVNRIAGCCCQASVGQSAALESPEAKKAVRNQCTQNMPPLRDGCVLWQEEQQLHSAGHSSQGAYDKLSTGVRVKRLELLPCWIDAASGRSTALGSRLAAVQSCRYLEARRVSGYSSFWLFRVVASSWNKYRTSTWFLKRHAQLTPPMTWGAGTKISKTEEYV